MPMLLADSPTSVTSPRMARSLLSMSARVTSPFLVAVAVIGSRLRRLPRDRGGLSHWSCAPPLRFGARSSGLLFAVGAALAPSRHRRARQDDTGHEHDDVRDPRKVALEVAPRLGLQEPQAGQDEEHEAQ